LSSCEVENPMPDMVTRNPRDGYEMVWVPPGKAIFGSRSGDATAGDNEKPQFEAEPEGYYLGLFCVTNEQYLCFVESTGHRPPDKADFGQPVWHRRS